MDLFSYVVSVFSLGISILALWSSHKNSARLVKIEEERDKAAQFQTVKAVLRAKCVKDNYASRRLTIWNQGQGTARDVVVSLDDRPPSECGSVVQEAQKKATVLGPGEVIGYTLVDSRGSMPNRVRVEWQDDSGEPGKYDSEL